MKKNQLLLFALCMLSLFFSSCSEALYQPNTINAPLMYGKGDYRINGGMTLLSPQPTLDIQGAYALREHIGLVFNNSISSKKGDDGNKNVHFVTETGAGLFEAFGNKKQGRIEIYSGYGIGLSKFKRNDVTDESALYHKIFFQPAIGYREKNIDFSFAGRLSIVNFGYLRDHNFQGEVIHNRNLGFTTFELVGTMGIGADEIRMYFQAGLGGAVSGVYSYESVAPLIDFPNASAPNPFIFNVGIAGSPWKERELEPPPIILPNSTTNQINSTSIFVEDHEFEICIQSPKKYPDVDLVKITFDGAILAKKIRPEIEPDCFSVSIKPNQKGVLQFAMISEGMQEGCPVFVVIKSGKSKQELILELKEDMIEEILLEAKK